MENRFLYIASNNSHKFEEFERLLGNQWPLKLATDKVLESKYPEESAQDYRGNARIKANFAGQKLNKPCFADDSGLEVSALDGAPGVHSARYGNLESDKEKRKYLLNQLKEKKRRDAAFCCVIALYLPSQRECLIFAGKIIGKIAPEERGSQGFGYDPLFIPEGFKQSFAEMYQEQKDHISHRAIAASRLKNFLLAGSGQL